MCRGVASVALLLSRICFEPEKQVLRFAHDDKMGVSLSGILALGVKMVTGLSGVLLAPEDKIVTGPSGGFRGTFVAGWMTTCNYFFI